VGGVTGDGAEADDWGGLRGAEGDGAKRQRTGDGAYGKITMHMKSPDQKVRKA
jgi:hypothetical protein